MEGQPKERGGGESLPDVREPLVKEVVQNLEGMDQSLVDIEKRGSAFDTKAANLSGEKGQELKARNKSLVERAKATTRRYKEALGIYAKLIVLGGMLVTFPIQDTKEPTFEGQTLEEQIDRAKKEMETMGITTEQKGSYKPIVNDLIYKGITPISYAEGLFSTYNDPTYSTLSKFIKIVPNIIGGREIKAEGIIDKEDAWRFYLGMPQVYNTFGISDYQPSKSEEKKYYYKIKDFWWKKKSFMKKPDAEVVKKIVEDIDEGADKWLSGYSIVMGRFRMQKGEDENGRYVSYYDKWDLNWISLEGKSGFFGKPFEIYDRLYYNPETFKPLIPIAPSPTSQRK